ncbi:MAG: VWA domain-containing protein [Chloroflexota bacterium]
MDQRIVEFIRAMRASGVRVSLAEAQDAMRAVDLTGTNDPNVFREVLRSTLVKDHKNRRAFDYFFPLFFTANKPPMENIPDNLSGEDQQKLKDALQSLMGDMGALQQLLQQLINGQGFSDDQLGQMAQQSGLGDSDSMRDRRWMERRMMQQAGMRQMQEMIEALLAELEEMGMGQGQLDEIRDMLEQNAQGLSEQVSQYAGASLAENMAYTDPDPKEDLMDVPFQALGHDEVDQIRTEIRRLAAKLRSRAALRQRRAKSGKLDIRRTMRANQRYGGVPLELRQKNNHVKPSLVVICDVSTSVRYCAEFLLTLIYELQDQVAHTDSFVFNADLAIISPVFRQYETQEAVQRALDSNPPGYYATDLGTSLDTFQRDFSRSMGTRTTVIILGDGRNNYRDPRLDIAAQLQRKARRLIWFVPEDPADWGTGDSDMVEYARRSDGCYYVNSLRTLAEAVDSVMADG